MSTVPVDYRCAACGRSTSQGTFYHYKKFPGCDPDRPLPKFDPPHGGYPNG